MLGVTIGIILLLLLIGLVVLQAIIEWGGVDTNKMMIKKNEEKPGATKKVIKRSVKKINRKGKK